MFDNLSGNLSKKGPSNNYSRDESVLKSEYSSIRRRNNINDSSLNSRRYN